MTFVFDKVNDLLKDVVQIRKTVDPNGITADQKIENDLI